MKKFLSIFISCIMLVSLSACSQQTDRGEGFPLTEQQESGQMISDINQEGQAGKELAVGELENTNGHEENQAGSAESKEEEESENQDTNKPKQGETASSGEEQQAEAIGSKEKEETAQREFHAQKQEDATAITDPTQYEGEYYDCMFNCETLQIKGNGDGTYLIQIGIHRIGTLYDGIGSLTEDGLEFTATVPDGRELTGAITFRKVEQKLGLRAMVVFTNEVWDSYSSVKSYEYYKTYDIPTIQDDLVSDFGLEGEEKAKMDPARAGEDPYVGEYNDYEVDYPNLQIKKNEDGTYLVQVGIYRIMYFDDGIGTLTENGIEFKATAPNMKELTGIITLAKSWEDDIATVTFTNEVFDIYSHVKSYEYYKVSNTPNIYYPDYYTMAEEGPEGEAEADGDSATAEPDFELPIYFKESTNP